MEKGQQQDLVLAASSVAADGSVAILSEADAADLFFLDLSEAAGSRLIVPMSCDASSRRCVGLDMDDRHLLGSNETLRRAAARMLAGAVDASAAEKIAPLRSPLSQSDLVPVGSLSTLSFTFCRKIIVR